MSGAQSNILTPKVDTVKQLLADCESEKAVLSTAIQQNELEHAKLMAQRGDIDVKIAHLRSALAPIRRLPPEILCEIFRLAGPFGTAPWWLGHISQSLRDLAVGLPALWTRVAINSRSKRPTTLLRLELEEQLVRARGASLSVSVSLYAEDWTNFVPLLDAVVSRCAQWEDAVFFVLSNHDLFFSRLSAARGNVPRLEVLNWSFGLSAPLDSPFRDTLAVAPRLRHASMDGEDSFELPWHQLVSCYLEAPHQLHHLCASTALVELTFNPNFGSESAPEPSHGAVTLPNLQSLNVVNDGLKYLVAPQLKRLKAPTHEIPALRSFLSRSECASLEWLALEEDDIRGINHVGCSELVAALKLVPAVQTLLLTSPFGFDDATGQPSGATSYDLAILFKAMTFHGSPEDILPRLSTLVFALLQSPFTHASFDDMALSRHSTTRIVLLEAFRADANLSAAFMPKIVWVSVSSATAMTKMFS
ncbi:F-box domain-containing protein [Mycena kentingensis (nom. inval.)]|nr:F-box domain-containing protein [Mycena kentingensis (nom. inval.)]